MAKEIEYERTFLAKMLPREISQAEGIFLQDVYIPESVVHPHLRLRQRGDTYVITKKVSRYVGDLSEMIEDTIPLEVEEFKALEACSRKVVVKRRYKVVIAGYPADVDVFDGKLAGLVLIDFEFTSNEEKQAFAVPEVCLAEVSQEEMLAGGMLAGKAYEDIEPTLQAYGYRKIFA